MTATITPVVRPEKKTAVEITTAFDEIVAGLVLTTPDERVVPDRKRINVLVNYSALKCRACSS